MNAFLKTLQGGEVRDQVNSIGDLKSVINKTFFTMELEKAENKQLAAQFKHVNIGPVGFVGIHTNCSIDGVRRCNDIDDDINKDHCLIYMPIKMGNGGQSWHYQGGKQARGGERIITIVEGSREYRVHRPSFLGLTLVIPNALLQARVPRFRQYCVTAHDASRGAFALTWDFIMSVWFNHTGLKSQDYLYYANSIVDLLVTALESDGKAPAVESNLTKSAYLQRALSFIDAHLNSTDISPELIARQLGIKKRYLYDVFNSHEQSLGTVIREKRLERCHQALADKKMANLSVTEIAYNWGFTSYTHFSRVFKEKYHISPRKFRQTKTVASR